MAQSVLDSPDQSKSIITTYRSDHGYYSPIFHLICRLFRSRLNSPNKTSEKGSLALTPCKKVLKTCNVSERYVSGIYLYDIRPMDKQDEPVKTHIYYFCGGSWQSPPQPQHWQLCAELATRIPNCIASIISSPLAPTNPAPVAFPMLLQLYRILLRDTSEAHEDIILAGDSSGGNLALTLVLEALRQDTESIDIPSNEKATALPPPHPKAIMAISPSIDLTRSNPRIDEFQPLDPLLTPASIRASAKTWHGDWAPTDPRVSPIHADLSLLVKAEVQVHGVIGTADVLAPDAQRFRDKCAEQGVHGKWLEWEKQMHCFPLMFTYGVQEAKEAVDWMVGVLSDEE